MTIPLQTGDIVMVCASDKDNFAAAVRREQKAAAHQNCFATSHREILWALFSVTRNPERRAGDLKKFEWLFKHACDLEVV